MHILARVRKEHEERKNRRRYERRANRSPRVRFASQEVAEDGDALSARAKREGTPWICLVGASSADPDIVHEWNNFCRLARDARTVHRNEPSEYVAGAPALLVLNRRGEAMPVDHEWLRYFMQTGALATIYVLSLFDDRRVLGRIQDLPNGGRVLVYDPESARCLDCMRNWQCSDDSYGCRPALLVPFGVHRQREDEIL